MKLRLVTVDCLLTETHIEKGGRGSGNCPIALLLNGKLRPGFYVGVSPFDVRVMSHGGQLHWYGDVPLVVTDFVIDYDQGRSVKPISFRIQLPERAVL